MSPSRAVAFEDEGLQAMPEAFEPRGNGIFRYRGGAHSTEESVGRFFDRLHQLEKALLARGRPSPRVLVDATRLQDITPGSRHVVYRRHTGVRHLRIATLGRNPFHRFLVNFFGLALGRGNSRYFTEEGEAEAWLLEASMDPEHADR